MSINVTEFVQYSDGTAGEVRYATNADDINAVMAVSMILARRDRDSVPEAVRATTTRIVVDLIPDHVVLTGCGLTRADFHPDGDESCVDGGTPDEHPNLD